MEDYPRIAAGLAVALVLVNLVTLALFALDKRRAGVRGKGGKSGKGNARRVPEARLLWLAALGGSPAAFWARAHFRHKTRKQPFVRHLKTIAGLQVMTLGAFAGWALATLTR